MTAAPPLNNAMLLFSLCLLAGAHAASPPTTRPRVLLQNATNDPDIIDAKKAAEYCKGPEIKKLSCGWAAEGVEPGRFSLGGNVWGGWLKQSELPFAFNSFRGSGKHQPADSWVSLACRPGKLVVQVVYKFTDLDLPGGYQNNTSYSVGAVLDPEVTLGTLGSNASPVTRCDLQLPPFTAGDAKSEAAAALKSTEVNCRSKGDAKVNSWYSDTLTFVWGGCDAVSKPGAKYAPTVPFINCNPALGFIVAKFEVQETK